ncbi:factor 5A [Seminavis robusta]|uniref:Factor 5A n=1 Tax=Seminavis robusta TaxID=568900 RepID=A0A9N8E3M1_9STRA|nr:factor 5A [Seminavis robusta]|eukprot:Sro616_g175960.1 factor 5A (212) ;mRNA; r:26192-26827
MPSLAKYQEAELFKGLSMTEDGSDNGAAMSSNGVSFATASELRVGKFCLIQGFPCRIRDIQRSAPGKHGHAKLRIVGVGIFDQRKRETIFSAHQNVLVPTVENRSNILATPQVGGFQIVVASDGMPFVLSWTDEENTPQNGSYVVLTVVIACGHFRITGFRPISEEEATALRKQSQEGTKEEELSSVLSKKEQRKLKRSLKKRAAVPTVVD